MRGSCGKCGRAFDGQMLCPQCGIQLVEEGEGTTIPLPGPAARDMPEGPSVPRRCALGAITLLGPYHGLKHLFLAVLVAQTGSTQLSANGFLGVVVAATLVAAVVAGTVNRWAEVTGLLLGAAAAGGVLGLELWQGGKPSTEWLAGVPALLVLLGAAGGFVGRQVMPPAPSIPRIGAPGIPDRIKIAARPEPLAWLSIVAAVTLIVAGTVYADPIRDALSRILAGHGGSFGASRLVTWQITIIAAVAGGFAAGANTRRGIGQGFVAGLLAAAGVLIATTVMGPSKSLMVEFWLDQLGQSEAGPLTWTALGGAVWIATLMGGWLGGQLLPPRRRK